MGYRKKGLVGTFMSVPFSFLLFGFIPATSSGSVVVESGRPVSITLDLSGIQYEVSVHWGVSFNDVFEDILAPVPTPKFWGDFSGARDAANAIRDKLHAEDVWPVPGSGDTIAIPRGIGTWGNPVVSHDVRECWQGSGAWRTLHGTSRDPRASRDSLGWATFSPSAPIPEPTSLLIWSAIALGGLGLAYRRRRKQAA